MVCIVSKSMDNVTTRRTEYLPVMMAWGMSNMAMARTLLKFWHGFRYEMAGMINTSPVTGLGREI